MIYTVNEQAFLSQMQGQLNEALTQAAEPIIQKNLIEIEKTMREKLASCLIQEIKQRMRVDFAQTEITIVIDQGIKQ